MSTNNESVREFIKLCQEAYYQGKEIVSNEEYDILVKRFPLEDTIGPEGDLPHLFRMYSLQKVYESRGDRPPFNPLGQVETPKLDGCAISLLYINGQLTQALTRGNGIKGKDITNNIRALASVPKVISQKVPTQITGEVLVTSEVENMRNYASGALQLKSVESFKEKILAGGLVFAAYGIQCATNQVGMHGTYLEDMVWLEKQMFVTVVNIHTILDWFPTDGKVHRINSNNEFNRMGWTNKFPRAAYASKTDEEGEVTTLTSVTWETGKSGKVTPVGHFDPVVIDDAKISRATLNNVGYIASLGLTLGCKIRVIRSGGVIPKIVERVEDEDLS